MTTIETPLLNQALHLPNGGMLRNRLAKAVMSEALGTYENRPTSDLVRLYRRWAQAATQQGAAPYSAAACL